MSKKSAAFRNHFSIGNWFSRHMQIMLASLGGLYRNPFSTLMTVSVIGIAMAMPTGLHTLITNVQNLNHNWDGGASISAFISTETTDKEAKQLAIKLARKPEIETTSFISRAESMEEFRRFSGFGSALETLDDNPLPAVILIYPTDEYSIAERTEELLNTIQSYPQVSIAQADLEWVKRLHGISKIVERGAFLLALLLSIAVLLIIGNTIRLEIQNRHAEIEINKIVGATNGFIRRPFLYDGFWYGLSGGIIAWLLISITFFFLSTPVANLAGLYESNYELTTLSAATSIILLFSGAFLGLLGSWIAVNKHLNAIKPE